MRHQRGDAFVVLFAQRADQFRAETRREQRAHAFQETFLGRIDQHEAGHAIRMRRREQLGVEATQRMADQDDRFLDALREILT